MGDNSNNPYGLSAQDVQDLKQIASSLPTGDPRQKKVSLLLNSVPTQFEQRQKTGLWDTIKGSASNAAGFLKGIAENAGPNILSNPDVLLHPIRTGMQMGEDAARRGYAAAESTPQDSASGAYEVLRKANPMIPLPDERTAMIAASVLGANSPKLAQDIRNHDLGGAVVESTPLLVTAAAPEVTRRAGPVTNALAGKASDFLNAPSTPGKLYSSYLKTVSDTPMPVPGAPPGVMRTLLRDMRNAGEDAAATRIAQNKATIGDLDIARQRANRLATSIYRSPGNYTTGMAEGADNFASAIRDQIYPVIEQGNGLPEGSLGKIKKLQGAVMQAERHPTLPNRLITKGGGLVGGGAAGFATGGPMGAVVGSALGQWLAEPAAQALDRGVIGLRTKALASRLPKP